LAAAREIEQTMRTVGVSGGSEPAGILAKMDIPEPRYSDREESRFYQAGDLTPEQTWQTLGDELARVLNDAQRAFWRAPLRMDPERVRWWHGAIFARHFPHDGGRFRRDRAFFGMVIPNGGMRQLEGAAPEAINRELQTVCSSFNRYADALGDPDSTGLLDRARAVAALYAGILRVHPFVDGNHRVSFVALPRLFGHSGCPTSSSRTMRTRSLTTMRSFPLWSPRIGASSPSRSCWLISSSAR
jgi:hypothetical protein